jgi:hypothetical protein
MEVIKGMEEPVLLSGTDGCGTKVKLAFLLDKHDTIGIDCVAMCVNDVACAGGEPLFFLDYIACGKNYPEKIATIVSGVAEGCKQSGCALIGGETAEHPGLMPEDEYDLAGFTVGVVDKKDIITGENLKAGDVLIGMASTGVHSNGFSLVRKIFKMDKETLNTYHEELGKTLGEALLAPTRIYVKALKNVKEAGDSSLHYGRGYEYSTDEMIKKAVEENPDCKIYLKIHPDVLTGKKSSDIDIKNIDKNISIISEDVNPISLLKCFSKVYTKTSGMGFEALLVGCECVCFGIPFYAGWGITDDRLTCDRRKRKLSVEEVFAGAYILYTKYVNPYSKKEIDIIETIETIAEMKEQN